MSKGLEALRKLDYKARYANTDDEGYSIKPYKATNFCEEEFNIIEKELKVLEIIIKKNVDIALLKECKNKSEYNIEVQCHNEDLMKPLEWWARGKLTQEEFNLVEEVFCNDK